MGGILFIIGLVLGLTLIVYPQRAAARTSDMNKSRITDLESGAPESYFEELRSLKTYSANTSQKTIRLFGILLVVFSLIGLLSYIL